MRTERAICFTCRFCKINCRGCVYCSLREKGEQCINYDKWESWEYVLDKIRAEIEQMNNIDYVEPITVDEVLQIIDKYKKQTE